MCRFHELKSEKRMKQAIGLLLVLLQLSLTGCNSTSGSIITDSTKASSVPATSAVTAIVPQTLTSEPTPQITLSPAITPSPTIAKEAFLPDWSDEYIDEYGYYDNVSEDMIEAYIESLENKGFRSFVLVEHIPTRLLVKDDICITITYPYYINPDTKYCLVGYQIEIDCHQHTGGISKTKAADMIEKAYPEHGPIAAILDVSPDNMGENCGLQMFQCIFGDQQGNYYWKRFLVGENSVSKEILRKIKDVSYTQSDGPQKNKVILIQVVGVNGNILLIRIFSSYNGDPILDDEAFYYCNGKRTVSLNKRDGKMYLVLTPRIFVGDGDHIHWWKDGESKEYEIILSDGTIRLNGADEWELVEIWPDDYEGTIYQITPP